MKRKPIKPVKRWAVYDAVGEFVDDYCTRAQARDTWGGFIDMRIRRVTITVDEPKRKAVRK